MGNKNLRKNLALILSLLVFISTIPLNGIVKAVDATDQD